MSQVFHYPQVSLFSSRHSSHTFNLHVEALHPRRCIPFSDDRLVFEVPIDHQFHIKFARSFSASDIQKLTTFDICWNCQVSTMTKSYASLAFDIHHKNRWCYSPTGHKLERWPE